MSLWHRMKVRLGLEDDFEDYDDEYYEDDDYAENPPPKSPYSYESSPSVRRVDRESDHERGRDRHGRGVSYLRGLPDPREYSREAERSSAMTHAQAAQVKMHIVEPRAFGEAQTIADKLKQGTPVIMNLTGSSADVSKRLLDFAAGLMYGLDGGLQKVSDKVFMLTPENVDVSAEDRRRLQDKGLFSGE